MSWAPDYVSTEELQAYVRAPADDPSVASIGTAASRAVDAYCNRQFGQLEAPAVFVYPVLRAALLGDGTWLLPIDDVQDVTGLAVTVDGAEIPAGTGGYRLWPSNAAAKGRPYTGLVLADRLCSDVSVSALFGWSEVPAAVPTAVRFQANRWWVRRESAYGTAGSPAEGTTMNLAARLDPDVRTVLAPYVRLGTPR